MPLTIPTPSSGIEIIGTNVASWGCDQAYASIGQGTSVTVHRVLRSVSGLQIAYTGMCRPNTFTTPTEVPADPYEVKVSIVRCTDETGVTEVGARKYFNWSGRYFYRVVPGTRVRSNYLAIPMSAGQYFKIIAYVNTRISTGGTVTTNGVIETGTLTANTNWPRTGNVGDATTANRAAAVQGVFHVSGATAFDPATYDKTASGPSSITNISGVPPSEIVGHHTDNSVVANLFPSVALFGDSITQGTGAAEKVGVELSGRGWAVYGLRHNRPWYAAATGGNEIQYWVGAYSDNWAYRHECARLARAAIWFLGTNDFANARTVEQAKADAASHWAMIRADGTRKIIGFAMLPRTSTTDAHLTTENQTQIISGFYEKADEFNAWMITQVGVAGGIDGFIDWRSTMCESALSSQYWKRSTEVLDTTATGVPTTTTTPVDATMVANEHQGKTLLIGTEAKVITSHTTSTFTHAAFSGAASSGNQVRVVNQLSNDGVHPSPHGHWVMGDILAANLQMFTL